LDVTDSRVLPALPEVPERMLAIEDTDYEYAVWGLPDGGSEIWRSVTPTMKFFHFLPRCFPDGYEGVPKGAKASVRRVGADKVVFPSKMQGTRLGMELIRPNLLERLRLDDRNSIEEIKVPSSFVGQSLRDLNLRKNYNVSVLAAGPSNQLTVNPPASHVLNASELLVVMGSSEALEALPSH
jgi:hypothetical protein